MTRKFERLDDISLYIFCISGIVCAIMGMICATLETFGYSGWMLSFTGYSTGVMAAIFTVFVPIRMWVDYNYWK